MRFDTSMESLIGIGRSESFADLNNPEFAKTLLSSSSGVFSGAGEITSRYLSKAFKYIANIPQQTLEVVTALAANLQWMIR